MGTKIQIRYFITIFCFICSAVYKIKRRKENLYFDENEMYTVWILTIQKCDLAK